MIGFDPSRPHPARVYQHWLGGKDTFGPDRAVAEKVAEIAQGINPDARVVYVDYDEIVLVHARALLARDDRTLAVAGDARDPASILGNPDVRTHLDFGQPVAVLFIAVLHFLGLEDDPDAVVAAFRDALAPGSHIAISHIAELPDGGTGPARAAATREAVGVYEELAAPFVLRTPEQITGLFAGLQLIDPGVVPVQLWQPTRGRPGPAVPVLGGLGRVSAPVSGAVPDARPAGELSATHPGGLVAGIPVSGNPSGSALTLEHRAKGEVRRVPCSPELAGLLRAHLAVYGVGPGGRLFRGEQGAPVRESIYNRVWQAARRQALTPAQVVSPLAARPYDLRHSCVSTWLAAGVESPKIAAWVGHSVAVLHRVYAHVLPDRDDVARQRIAHLMFPPSRETEQDAE